MSDNELRDRIAKTLDRNFDPDLYPTMAAMFRDYAQAIIDDLGLTVHGDDCGYHEIHGSYDTRFEDEQ